jgi:hypothetical protein
VRRAFNWRRLSSVFVSVGGFAGGRNLSRPSGKLFANEAEFAKRPELLARHGKIARESRLRGNKRNATPGAMHAL